MIEYFVGSGQRRRSERRHEFRPVKGVDEPGYMLEQAPQIAAYEAAHPAPINALA